MKKAIQFFFLLFISYMDYAQPTILPPSENKIGLSDAQSLIMNYHAILNPWDSMPSSFVINATALKTYLEDQNTPRYSYLHVYFAIDGTTGLQLVFVPTIDTGMDNITNLPSLIHDTNSLYNLNTYVTNSNDTQTVNGKKIFHSAYDYELDDPSAANIVDFDSSFQFSSTPIDKKIASPEIVKYQHIHPVSRNTLSFNFSARRLKLFLEKNDIEYLQIYLGYDPDMAYEGSVDNLTLIIVGINNEDESHIYGSDFFGHSRVFDECKPCPICDICQDNEMRGIGPSKTLTK